MAGIGQPPVSGDELPIWTLSVVLQFGMSMPRRDQLVKPRRLSSSFGSSGMRGGAVRHINATSSGVSP